MGKLPNNRLKKKLPCEKYKQTVRKWVVKCHDPFNKGRKKRFKHQNRKRIYVALTLLKILQAR
jgi:hypothetical protein